jgi:hypothetical protein
MKIRRVTATAVQQVECINNMHSSFSISNNLLVNSCFWTHTEAAPLSRQCLWGQQQMAAAPGYYCVGGDTVVPMSMD